MEKKSKSKPKQDINLSLPPKLFNGPKLYKLILYDIGTQNDLDQKLEEIVCAIGLNTFEIPVEVVTTSPISKAFNS